MSVTSRWWDSGRLHFKAKVDQLWGLCHCRSKFNLNWCKKYESLGSFWSECDYRREKLIFVGKTGGRFCAGEEFEVCSVNQNSITVHQQQPLSLAGVSSM